MEIYFIYIHIHKHSYICQFLSLGNFSWLQDSDALFLFLLIGGGRSAWFFRNPFQDGGARLWQVGQAKWMLEEVTNPWKTCLKFL